MPPPPQAQAKAHAVRMAKLCRAESENGCAEARAEEEAWRREKEKEHAKGEKRCAEARAKEEAWRRERYAEGEVRAEQGLGRS